MTNVKRLLLLTTVIVLLSAVKCTHVVLSSFVEKTSKVQFGKKIWVVPVTMPMAKSQCFFVLVDVGYVMKDIVRVNMICMDGRRFYSSEKFDGIECRYERTATSLAAQTKHLKSTYDFKHAEEMTLLLQENEGCKEAAKCKDCELSKVCNDEKWKACQDCDETRSKNKETVNCDSLCSAFSHYIEKDYSAQCKAYYEDQAKKTNTPTPVKENDECKKCDKWKECQIWKDWKACEACKAANHHQAATGQTVVDHAAGAEHGTVDNRAGDGKTIDAVAAEHMVTDEHNTAVHGKTAETVAGHASTDQTGGQPCDMCKAYEGKVYDETCKVYEDRIYDDVMKLHSTNGARCKPDVKVDDKDILTSTNVKDMMESTTLPESAFEFSYSFNGVKLCAAKGDHMKQYFDLMTSTYAAKMEVSSDIELKNICKISKRSSDTSPWEPKADIKCSLHFNSIASYPTFKFTDDGGEKHCITVSDNKGAVYQGDIIGLGKMPLNCALTKPPGMTTEVGPPRFRRGRWTTSMLLAYLYDFKAFLQYTSAITFYAMAILDFSDDRFFQGLIHEYIADKLMDGAKDDLRNADMIEREAELEAKKNAKKNAGEEAKFLQISY